MVFATLKYELTDGIAAVTINRPEKNNAISMEMRGDFRALADELYANEAVRVVVFTGTGKTFCVGADVSTFETDWNTPLFRANTRLLTSFFNDLEALEKPLIAAINGTCVGGGLELALACDLRIAARSARFGLPENNLGLIPGIGGCSRLVKLVGFGRAKELVLTGEIVSADEDELYANEAVRVVVFTGTGKTFCVGADVSTFETLIKTADHREGVKAFREKRRPRFEGR